MTVTACEKAVERADWRAIVGGQLGYLSETAPVFKEDILGQRRLRDRRVNDLGGYTMGRADLVADAQRAFQLLCSA